jgi:ABC-type multidrug transport system fused ATPase/permease subunit
MKALKAIRQELTIISYFFRSHQKATAVVFLTMIAASFLESLNLAALYPIINHGLNLGNESKTLHVLNKIIGALGIQNLFMASCVFLILITVLATAVKLMFNYSMCRLIAQIVSTNQKEIFEKFIQAPYSYYLNNQQGQLIYAGTIAPRGVAQNILFVIRIASNLVSAIFFTILLFILAWQGTLVVIGIGLIYVFFIKRLIQKIVNPAARLSVMEDTKKNILLNEYVNGIKTIKALVANPYWKKKYDDAVGRSVNYNFQVMVGRALPENFIKLIFFVLIGVVGFIFSLRLPSDFLQLIPVLATFVAVASRLMPYLNVVGNDVVNIARFIPDAKIVYDILERMPRSVDQGDKQLDAFQREFVFKDVEFKYPGMEENLLKAISFSIPKNKMTAIVGPSGSGKTTIVNLLLRFYEPSQGNILIDGCNIQDFILDSYLNKIGYVSQENFSFNGTIEENIRFGNTQYTQQQIEEAAQLAQAHEFIIQTEKGYQTIVGDAGLRLSGGQRQRIAIARVLLRRPEIIIFDEATSSLDNISEKLVREAINKITQFMTVVIIAHRLSTVQAADKIIVLNKGQVVEEGAHKELIERGDAYFELYSS